MTWPITWQPARWAARLRWWWATRSTPSRRSYRASPRRLPASCPDYAGGADAVRQTLAAEGPRGLYNGMGAPLATVAAFNAVLFTVRGQMEAVLRSEPGVLNPKGFCTPCPGKSGERSCLFFF